uniref:NADH-ubiquinone oxidoreductase chain 6 n=1 Tax=Phauda flammans TaxID=2720869 RepID=A0A6G9KW93_9NEOP|nr:NADH dehydrogenase subunit 6 [Phauda flammans]QIQ56362.1 NADH dehydrogenase subunit 6 [Phauda flammans]
MKLFLSMMIISFSILMFFLNHPMSIGLMILIQTFLTCLLSSMMIKTYWFSYILFLTFLGGLLVLFIYISSIASNEMFKISSIMILFFFMLFLISMFLSFFFNNLTWMNFFNSDMELMNNFLFFNNENKINLSKLYNQQTHFLMIMLMIYLFITLVAVVKIINIFYGPIRSFN